jgi:hypothetical protein
MKFFKVMGLLVFLFVSPGIMQKAAAASCECSDQCCFCCEDNHPGLILCSCDEEGNDEDEIDLVLVNENNCSSAVHIERHLHLVRVSRLCSLLRYSEDHGSRKGIFKKAPAVFRFVAIPGSFERFSCSLVSLHQRAVTSGSVPLTNQQRSLRL